MKRHLRSRAVVKQSVSASLMLTFAIGFSGGAQAADVNTILASVSSISDVDARQASIEKRLEDAYGAGRLTQAQYQSFKQSLSRVADQEAVFRASDSSLSLWESLRLQFDLDRLVKELEASLSDRQTGFVDVYARRDEIVKRLSVAYSDGRLTAQEYAQIQMELDTINKSIQASSAQTGHLSVSDSIRLVLELDRLSQKLTRTVHDRQVSLTQIDVRQAELSKRIESGVASGKITDREANDLKAEFKRIADKEEALRKLGRPLTSEEQLTLALDLEKLSGQIDSHLNDEEVQNNVIADVDRRQSEVDRNLAQALSSGLVTVSEAQVYKSELDAISKKTADFRTAGGGQLNIVQAQNVLIDLERLNGKIDRAVYSKQPVWVGIDASIEDYRRRIADAKLGQRLSEVDEVELKSDLDKIVANKATYAASSQGIDSQEAISLSVDLTRLNGKMFKLIKDREVAVLPDVSRRKDEISRRIAEGTSSGKLTTDETRSLLEDLDRIAAREAAFKAADGVLDDREKLSVALDLERLAARTEKEIRDNPFVSKSIQARKEQADQTISNGTLTGKLSAQEVQNLRTEYNRILAFEQSSLTSGSSLDAREALTIAADLDRLIKDVESQMKNSETALPDLAKRESELYQRITEGVMQGRLAPKDADSLKREFYRLMDLEAKYRSIGGLSFGEHAALALELEKLSASIENSMKESVASLPDVDARQSEIDNRLADAVASGRMTSEQSREFTRDLDRIARDEVTYRFSGSGLSYAESLALITELEKVSARLDTKLAGSSPQWNGIDGRVSETSKRISDALLAQKVDASAGNQLKNELDRISQAKVAFSTSGGGLTLAETESLVRDLERLNKDIDNRTGVGRAIAWTDIDARQARLEARIAQDIAAGKLSSQKAKQAKQELRSLSQVKATFRNSGGYSYTQLVSMAQALDKIGKLVGFTPRYLQNQ